MLHKQTGVHAPLIGVSVLASGLFSSMGSDLNLVLVHLIFPTLWGVSIGLWWPAVRWWLRTLGLIAIVLVSAVLRDIHYGATTGWQYSVTSDTVAQYVMLYSAGAQLLVSVLALFLTDALIGRRRRKHAA